MKHLLRTPLVDAEVRHDGAALLGSVACRARSMSHLLPTGRLPRRGARDASSRTRKEWDMSSLTQSAERSTARPSATATPTAARDRARRRALWVTATITLFSIGLLVDLLLVTHTSGDEIWGPITAAMAALAGALSLAVLFLRGRNPLARYGLIALWLTVAFFGFGGYNSHRLPLPEGTVDARPRPLLAPLVFTGLGLAGAVVLRSGTKGN